MQPKSAPAQFVPDLPRGISIDLQYEPIIWVRIEGKVTRKIFQAQAEYLQSRLDNEQSYAILNDMRKASGLSNRNVGSFWTEWTKPREALLRKYVYASAAVFSNPLLSSIANAVVMVSTVPHPQKSFRRIDPAMKYLEGYLSFHS